MANAKGYPDDPAGNEPGMIDADVGVVDMVIGLGGWRVAVNHFDERRFSCFLLRGSSEMCRVEVVLGLPDRHGTPNERMRIELVTDPATRRSRAVVIETLAGGIFLGAQLTRMLTELGCWWPRKGEVSNNRRDAETLLLSLAATRLGLPLASVLGTARPGESLPKPLPDLVQWSLQGALEVQPCTHIAASRLLESEQREPSSVRLLLRLAERVVGEDWVALARSCHWPLGFEATIDPERDLD